MTTPTPQGGTQTGGTETGGSATTGGAAGEGAVGSAPAGGSGGALAGSGGDGGRFPCGKSEPVLTASGEPTGLERCEYGMIHRVRAVECPVSLPDPTGIIPEWTGCHSNADCTERPYGYCVAATPVNGSQHCEYACAVDSDCASSELCECGASYGKCVAATCVTDDDCANGELCGLSDDPGRCLDGPVGALDMFACTSPLDACRTNAMCSPPRCGLEGEQRVCMQAALCGIGRPFIVAGETRVAGTTMRDDWAQQLALAPVTADDAACAARHWEMAAKLEHASIASFARFSLELLAFGAPPELVSEAVLAMADETRHAELCFGVASAYAEQPLGPGPLAVGGAAPRATLRDAVLDAVIEGCIGEAASAIEATETLEHVTDAALRGILAGIAADERRHAELAFRFVRWALERDPALREPVLAVARRELVRGSREPGVETPDERRLLALGVYPERFRARLRQEVVREVVIPCLRGLLESTGGGEPQKFRADGG